MSRLLPVVTGAEAARVAEGLGFELRRQRGSHAVLVRAGDRRHVVIPIHAGRSLKPKTLRGIVGDLGITVERFRELL